LASVVFCCSSFALVIVATNHSMQHGIVSFLFDKASELTQLIFWVDNKNLISEDLNVATIILGILGWATKFSGNLMTQIARDGILFASLTLGKASSAFNFKGTLQDAIHSSQTLKKFSELKEISNRINSAYKVPLRLYLLASIFMLTVFADQYFDPSTGKVIKIVKLLNVVFLIVTFYFANQAAKVVIYIFELKFKYFIRGI